MTFEDMWKSLEEKDTTGKYKQAREMAELGMEQLEYAYNSGFSDAKSKYERPQGEWVVHSCYKDVIICSNCNSGDNRWHKDFKFCPNCGSEMRGGAKMTNKEAIKYLIAPIATSTEPSAEYLKQKEAYDLAIKALEFIEENYPKTFIDYLNGEQI